MKMSDLGWNAFFENHGGKFRDQNFSAMRITRENRGKYIARNEDGEFSCEVAGRFMFENTSKAQFPAVGDWVLAVTLPHESKAIIHTVLPRKSVFSRKVAGEITDEQTVAANIDTIFIITGLDLNYNLRRIERYLSIAWKSGAIPVILLNKSDLCPEYEQRKLEVESIAAGVEVNILSAHNRRDVEGLKKYIKPGKTAAFLGSSGVGKSSIINTLLGREQMQTNEVSELGSRGRHTTTFRELLFLPDGGMVIDTPGMREIQVWGEDDGLETAFDDIAKLTVNCKFNDCSHTNEPGCAVQKAIDAGALDEKRFENYLKLKKEFEYVSSRRTMNANAVEKAKWKSISKYAKELKKGGDY